VKKQLSAAEEGMGRAVCGAESGTSGIAAGGRDAACEWKMVPQIRAVCYGQRPYAAHAFEQIHGRRAHEKRFGGNF
jgi:hypothetical protein